MTRVQHNHNKEGVRRTGAAALAVIFSLAATSFTLPTARDFTPRHPSFTSPSMSLASLSFEVLAATGGISRLTGMLHGSPQPMIDASIMWGSFATSIPGGGRSRRLKTLERVVRASWRAVDQAGAFGVMESDGFRHRLPICKVPSPAADV
jgi:hypothetical protein